MNLAATIELHAGGPGSGCNPEAGRCGRLPGKHDNSENFDQAIRNTPGAELTPEGLKLDITRYQRPEQGGMQSVRNAVFFLPERKSPYQHHYTTGKNGYGGDWRVEGTAVYKNPLVVKGASGGKAPERAYDMIKGKGAYDKMRNDVLQAALSGYYKSYPSKIAGVQSVLEQYGGDAHMASYIVENSSKGNQLAYALQEHIVAAAVRNAGYDAVIGYNKLGGVMRLSEVFDVNMRDYPMMTKF